MKTSAARKARAKGFRVVGSDDVATQQANVAAESTNIATAIDTCKAQLPASSLDAWYQLAHDCLVFSSASSPNAMQGTVLLSELATWRATLEALPCTVPTLKQVPAAPPAAPGGLLEALEARLAGNAVPLLLIGALVLLASGKLKL